MIYKKWMSFLKDDVKLTEAVIPSAHNSCTYRMKAPVCCQDGDFYEQFSYGIRHFTLRFDTNKKGEIVLCHGIMKNEPLEQALKTLRKVIDEGENEFFILDIAPFEIQHIIGNFNLQFTADKDAVDALIEKYLEPSEYAYCGPRDLREVTMGELRASGKRYVLLNSAKEYKFSVYCPWLSPWNGVFEKVTNALFTRKAVGFYDSYEVDGIFWFRTQQAPERNPKVGIRVPRKVDEAHRELFNKIIESIANTPEYLAKVNVVSGDFMTEDYTKARNILLLNLLKNNIIEDKQVEFVKRLWKSEK